jgi:alpha-galactosidase
MFPMSYKISIIGGGSSIFTPQVIALFSQSKSLQGSTISLMDINEHRLGLMESLGRQLVEKTGADLIIESTTNRVESLTGANFVITSISVGGFDAWEKDLEIPAKYGIYVPFGDAIGPGGIFRAFRHAGPMVEMCKDLERVSPNAWVFNYTNPATTLCTMMLKESNIRVVSLCTNTVPLRNEKFMASWAGAKPGEIITPPPVGGINHCSGILDIRYKDGKDALPQIREKIRHPIVKWCLETYGILPLVWPHWLEFFPALCRLKSEYKGRVQGLTMDYGMPIKDMTHELERVRKWEDLVAGWVVGVGEVSIEAIPETEPVQVLDIIEAIIEDRNEVHVVNLKNHGAIDNMPDDCVVEVGSLVSAQGIEPIHAGRVPKALAAFWGLHLDVQDLTVEAALTGDRRIAQQAFELDPFIASKLTINETSRMLDEMLHAHAANLPQFQ